LWDGTVPDTTVRDNPGMRISDLRQRLRSLGALPKHEHRVLRLWSNALPQTAGKRQIEHFLPATLRAALPALGLNWLAERTHEPPLLARV